MLAEIWIAADICDLTQKKSKKRVVDEQINK